MCHAINQKGFAREQTERKKKQTSVNSSDYYAHFACFPDPPPESLSK